MEPRKELKILFWIVAVFAAVFFLPLGSERFMTAIDATLDLAKWYAQDMSCCVCCPHSLSRA